jgi:hypothetical protein
MVMVKSRGHLVAKPIQPLLMIEALWIDMGP